MAAALILSMTACTGKNIDIEEVKKTEGTMLTIGVISSSDMTLEENERSSRHIDVSYSGYAYNPNPVNHEGVLMTDEDYLAVYEFCLDAVESGRYKDYQEEIDDGIIYSFTFYDENAVPHNFYTGAVYGDSDLNRIRNIITSYSLD